MGFDSRKAGITFARQVWIVGKLCKANDLPSLNTIVVNQSTGVPGSELTLRDEHTVVQDARGHEVTDLGAEHPVRLHRD